MDTYSPWIGGKTVAGSGEVLSIKNPATGEVFAQCQTASIDEINAAVQSAQDVHKSGVWSRLPRHTRADVLDKAADLLIARLDGLITLEVQQTGRAIREMKAQVPSLVRWFRYYAALLRTEERSVLPTSGKLHNWIDRIPLGVVVLITSFNHPLLIAVKKLAPALAAGNTVLLKPSELTPLTSLLLGPILKEAGLPDGVFNVIPGYGITTGKALVSHPLVRKVDITGGTAAGRAIGSIVGGNLARLTAELGGKAPVVVFGDADLEAAVNGVAFGAFIASGQTCVAATRIIVEKSILPKFLELLTKKAQSIQKRMGAPTNVASMMGPIISEKQMKNLEGLVEESVSGGFATAACGGARLTGLSELDQADFDKGFYYPPTVLVSAADGNSILKSKIWKEEAFGPVIVVAEFSAEQEAIDLANDSEFGLGAAFWTKDLSRAYRVSESINTGIVWVNTHHRNDPSSPWGGATSSSGVGSENGVDSYNAYTTTKSTIINYASSEEMKAEDWFGEEQKQVRYG
ncbi:unnamed protein product [Clonostachys rosea f. rosea IK726]|uniref:aldehyde dehydrogenase (NAD(+)) n=2 Tax=Bionectria ochroleuca TaxID=29856 RepID=A0A0B7KKZ5_BIOOC|nr:unnamed protein product [Clonostachys rosea f. rosea IK726]